MVFITTRSPRSPKSLCYSGIVHRVFFLGLALSTVGFFSPVAADIIETFDNGSDNGDWQLTSNPIRTLGIQPTGGDPGAYLRGDVESATPTWYVPLGAATDFLGDYSAMGVTKMSADINIFVGNQEPNRTLTLDLMSTFGTGDFANEVEAYYIGPDISDNKPGWVNYEFSLNARAQHIPNGWVVLHGRGSGDQGRLGKSHARCRNIGPYSWTTRLRLHRSHRLGYRAG